jgi:hypothetical protein
VGLGLADCATRMVGYFGGVLLSYLRVPDNRQLDLLEWLQNCFIGKHTNNF